jgi:hypothetical protein
MVVWIQYFNFSLRWEAMGWNVIGRWSRGTELILTLWEGSVIRCGGVVTSARGEAASRWRKGRDDISWVDANLTGEI